MKVNLHNPYGYKVCCKEKGKKHYVRYFIARSYKQAVKAKQGYVRYPPTDRTTKRQLKKPTWNIFPITKKEVIKGIWRENPF